MSIVLSAWQNGDWALLQNCHLGLPFLLQLEEKLRQQLLPGGRKEEIHEDARLWVTSEPHKSFPIGLLQMSIKLTNEPPQGIKAGLVRTYSWMSQDYLEMFRRPEWRPMLFTQCFLHSVVVERRKFGPIGFSVPYEFNQGDWNASVQFLINHMTTIGEALKNPVNRDTVCYMVSDIQYGGRITDNNDRALFKAITEFLYDMRITNPDKVRDTKVANERKGAINALAGGNVNSSSCELTEFAPGYGIPLFDDINKHREFIRDTYPDVDGTEVFQMHSNADITYRTRQAQEALKTILDIQPRDAVTQGGVTREEKVLSMADNFLRQLPENWSVDRKLHIGDRQPLSIFAGQEIDRLGTTIRIIRQTCTDLKLAVAVLSSLPQLCRTRWTTCTPLAFHPRGLLSVGRRLIFPCGSAKCCGAMSSLTTGHATVDLPSIGCLGSSTLKVSSPRYGRRSLAAMQTRLFRGHSTRWRHGQRCGRLSTALARSQRQRT
ncbi:putative Dynein heavy chain and region D6 of dynein motor [Trypanosoma vivax]|nr:putative Dynein heavy chain and region D6 of dynein motor [Trypanosoma vivax]